jgi:hypothetical protein
MILRLWLEMRSCFHICARSTRLVVANLGIGSLQRQRRAEVYGHSKHVSPQCFNRCYRVTIAGAVAFSRQGSPDLGEFEDAVILKTFGEVPDDMLGIT